MLSESFLFEEFLFDRVGDAQINLQHFVHQHLHHFIFVLLVVLLDFGDLLLSFSLQIVFKLFVGFLYLRFFTSAFSFSNSNYFYLLYLATYNSAASLASLSFLCLNKILIKNKDVSFWETLSECLPFFLGVFDDGGGFAFGSEEFVNVGSVTHWYDYIRQLIIIKSGRFSKI